MSTDYQNSILWRGEDPLKKKFKASHEPDKKVTRYFPGQAPAWAADEQGKEKKDDIRYPAAVVAKKREDAAAAAKKKKEEDIIPQRKRRDRGAAAVIAEDPGSARLRRLQASESAGDTGAERLLRHRVVHDSQVLEAAPSSADKREEIARMTQSIKDKLKGKLDKLEDKVDKEDKETFEDPGVKDLKELKEEDGDAADEDLDMERPVKSEVKSEVKEEDEEAVADRRQQMRDRALQRRKQEEDNMKEEEEVQEEEIEESEYETESEDNDPRSKAMHKPVFISKNGRDTIKEKAEMEKQEVLAEERAAEKVKERKVESKSIVIDVIKQEAEADAVAALGLDDASDIELMDDNDEINEAEEYELWKIRELKRMKRDTVEKMDRQKEIEFIEGRRQMTDEERAADDERLDAGHKFKDDSKAFAFLQKYYHRGVFYQDKAVSGEEPLYLRDYHEPTAEEKFDKQTLPKAMQVRRGLFGKKGQTKHTHLTDVDTTDTSAAWAQQNKVVQRYQERMAGASGVNDFSRPVSSKK